MGTAMGALRATRGDAAPIGSQPPKRRPRCPRVGSSRVTPLALLEDLHNKPRALCESS